MGDLVVDLHGIFEENGTSTDGDYDYQYPGDESFVKRGSEAVWVPALYSIVFFVGILGNIILLTVLAQKRRLWSISDTFILHLSIADILLLLMLPFWAAQTSQPCDWSFGIFSQIFGVIFKLNYYCGIFLLFCISLQNYLSVIHGIQLYSHEKPFFVHISCLSVWLISVVLTIPDWIFPGAKKDSTEEKTCVHIYPQSGTDWQLWSRLLHHIFGLVLPAFMLIILSYMLWRRCSSNAARMQRNITVILSLVGVFCLCWMPYNFILVLDTVRNRLQKHPNDSHESSEGSLKTLLVVASALGCLHASLRPLLYLGLCGNFRQHLLAMLRCNKTEPKASLWDLGVDQRQQPDHSQVQQEELEQMTVVESQLAQ
ncbi:C-X-C chemokine receptor type 3-like [Oreochromis aureus]|uniref:G-protein coupled receptors family 1 profile domain-containing protein n=1 Tax=Oreochromis aureus TaxID=47969 RepID=A0AAZ1XZV1_OREAU|nr:C-X-C chemokine receptor type 3-like [Oreochromis aureus]XP_031581967.2 C-X-C chemokine receptor type 3-like [Oreochromis aureus]XP_031581968.2 C-X-C chemokine receptor type 3-like [Oreochromis aureus]XP_039474983.1 C-X-C chemokine receptor type 3-like [Oreochromis aureus]